MSTTPPPPLPTPLPPVDPSRYAPTAGHPVRAKSRHLRADARVESHRHPWAQVALSTTGVVRMTAGNATFIVPPSRALWVPADVAHRVTVIEDAELRTLYIQQSPGQCGPVPNAPDQPRWRDCQVLEVSSLLRELVLNLPTEPGIRAETAREQSLSALVLDELQRARPVQLGVGLPRDKRLRALCEAVLDAPTRHATLEDWARDSGASPRTVARLFRAELGTTFLRWRQQVLLAKAVSLAGRKMSMSRIASELGYASASAFSAMVRRKVGTAPRQFLA
jgi:AraC-like DNA-binding protein